MVAPLSPLCQHLYCRQQQSLSGLLSVRIANEREASTQRFRIKLMPAFRFIRDGIDTREYNFACRNAKPHSGFVVTTA